MITLMCFYLTSNILKLYAFCFINFPKKKKNKNIIISLEQWFPIYSILRPLCRFSKISSPPYVNWKKWSPLFYIGTLQIKYIIWWRIYKYIIFKRWLLAPPYKCVHASTGGSPQVGKHWSRMTDNFKFSVQKLLWV